MKRSFFLVSIITLLVLTACGPYKTPKYKDVGANETAFLIPLEQGTGTNQKMLKSVEYLEQKKIPAKRVYIEQKQIETGRYYGDYIYIPTDTLIIVHRAPVTREWAKETSLTVESKESIGFSIPVNCTGSVLEEDASKFLYHYGGQSIEYVMDHNVRPYMLDLLTTSFGRLTLDECQKERNDVYEKMKAQTIAFFKDYGLTVINLGIAGQYTYTDNSIQEAINTKFISEMKITAAQNEATAAKKFAEASESIKKQKELDVEVQVKAALADAIRAGKLTWPQTLVIGKDCSMMDVWGAKNLGSSPK